MNIFTILKLFVQFQYSDSVSHIEYMYQFHSNFVHFSVGATIVWSKQAYIVRYSANVWQNDKYRLRIPR